MLNVKYEDLEKISNEYEIRGHLGEKDFGLDKESFDDERDYELYPKKEWISKEDWDEFLEKAHFPYWLSFEDILWESRMYDDEFRLKY